MSDASERKAPHVEAAAAAAAEADADAWEKACAEDLAAEQARRRAEYGPQPGSAAEELRKLVDAVSDKLSGLQSPLLGAVGQGVVEQTVKQVVQQAKAVVEPVIERNPDVFDHLAAAGSELLAAYRSAVEKQESRWTRGGAAGGDTSGGAAGGDAKGTDRRDEGPATGEHIDLD
ncbi:DUF5304 domain-containing protein [Streptomyces sp. WAC 01529]|uniref:DUF5304 domain-containing protein n=1 Tax=Streptomyces sp. WAC 01529 TaxID=2203205 RepID=UPI0013DF7FB3|nr:DUF5304 domain-containing protein [Streptomyces sp. WAC 01529]